MADVSTTREERGRLLDTAMRGLSSLQKPENLIKYASLIILVVQNASQALYTGWASKRPVEHKFLKTVVILFQEVFKLVACVLLLCIQNKAVLRTFKEIYKEIFVNWKDTLKVCVPAGIYVIQNNLLLVALENLPAAVFMVSYQLKILTTAMFTVLILRRPLSILQWVALVILFAGIALVQLDQKSQQDESKNMANSVNTTTEALWSTIGNYSTTPYINDFESTANASITVAANETLPRAQKHKGNLFFGLGAVLVACVLSGFAGIYLEKILKQRREVSVWMRNFQLALISLPTAIATCLIKDFHKINNLGFFVGFDLVVWGIVSLGAFGGLLVAVVIKFADNILKAFATSFAIILGCIVAVLLLSFKIRLMFIGGTLLVIGAIFVYTLFPYRRRYQQAPTEPPPIQSPVTAIEADGKKQAVDVV